MISAADIEAGALFPIPRPPVPPAPDAQRDLAGPHVVIGPPCDDLDRLARLACVGMAARPHPKLAGELWCIMHGLALVGVLPRGRVEFRGPDGAAGGREPGEWPRVDLDPAAAFAFAFTVAPGWRFLSLSQCFDRTTEGPRASGAWVCKLGGPGDNRVRIGQGVNASLAVVMAALDARCDDLARAEP